MLWGLRAQITFRDETGREHDGVDILVCRPASRLPMSRPRPEVLDARAQRVVLQQRVDICERDVSAQTNFLGVILNKCRYGSGAGYEYSYY